MKDDGFIVFKGLQKPLELMGIRGRFLIMAALAVGGAFLGFILFSLILGKAAGFIALLAILAGSYATIIVKQRKGVHNKRRDNFVRMFTCLFKH